MINLDNFDEANFKIEKKNYKEIDNYYLLFIYYLNWWLWKNS